MESWPQLMGIIRLKSADNLWFGETLRALYIDCETTYQERGLYYISGDFILLNDKNDKNDSFLEVLFSRAVMFLMKKK